MVLVPAMYIMFIWYVIEYANYTLCSVSLKGCSNTYELYDLNLKIKTIIGYLSLTLNLLSCLILVSVVVVATKLSRRLPVNTKT